MSNNEVKDRINKIRKVDQKAVLVEEESMYSPEYDMGSFLFEVPDNRTGRKTYSVFWIKGKIGAITHTRGEYVRPSGQVVREKQEAFDLFPQDINFLTPIIKEAIDKMTNNN